MKIKHAAAVLGALTITGGLVLTQATPAAQAGVGSTAAVGIFVDGNPNLELDSENPPVTPNQILFYLQTDVIFEDPCEVVVLSADITATGGADYTPIALNITFPDDNTLFTPILVTITPDNIFEPDLNVGSPDIESMRLQLLPGPGVNDPPCPLNPAALSAIGEIEDDDPPGALYFNLQPDFQVCESAGTVWPTLRMNRNLQTGEVITFDLATQNGTAVDPADYDGFDFSNLDDPPTSISISGPTFFTVYDNGYPDPDISDTPDDTSDDVILLGANEIWDLAGVNVNIPIVDDWTPEFNEFFHVILANVVFTSSQSLFTLDVEQKIEIQNDDIPGNEITVFDASAVEGNQYSDHTKLAFTIQSKFPATDECPIKLYYETADGTAVDSGGDDEVFGDKDYFQRDGFVTINPGQTQATVNVYIKEDTNIEDDETMFLNIVPPPIGVVGANGDLTGQGTIINDDFPDVNIDDVQVVEGTGGSRNLVFTASLAAPGWPPCTPHSAASAVYSLSDGPAHNATGGAFPPLAGNTTTDYGSLGGIVTFAPHECSKSISVPIVTDSRPENNENFTATLSNLQDLNPGDLVGQGTIWNDDNWTVSGIDISVLEGTPPDDVNHVVNVSLTLNAPAPDIPAPPGPPSALSLNWALEDLPGGASAAQPDYIDDNGTVTWNAGTTQVTVPVTIVVDEVIELDEALLVAVSNPTSLGQEDCTGGCFRLVTDGKDPVTVTIINDDIELPETGTSHVPEMTAIGFGLAAAGLALVLGTRRRRPSIS